MNGGEALNASIIQTLQGSHPQFKIGVDRIFHEYGDIVSLQGICNFLYGKGIGRGSRAYPEHVDAIFQCCLYVCGIGDLRGSKHTALVVYASQPGESLFAHTFKAAGLRPWFPNSCSHDADAVGSQLERSRHHLFLRLC